jgi:hypothetical protein
VFVCAHCFLFFLSFFLPAWIHLVIVYRYITNWRALRRIFTTRLRAILRRARLYVVAVVPVHIWGWRGRRHLAPYIYTGRSLVFTHISFQE